MAPRKSELLADLLEDEWDAANYYPEAFSVELAVWKTKTELALEVSTHFRAGRLAGLALGKSRSRVNTKSVEQGRKGAGDEHLPDEDPTSYRRF